MDSELDCSMEIEQTCKSFKLPCLVPLDVLKARFSSTLEINWPGKTDISSKSHKNNNNNNKTNGRHSTASNGSDSSGIENDRRITFVNLCDDDSHSEEGESDDISSSIQNRSGSQAFRSSSHRTNGEYPPDDSKFTIPHPPKSVITKKTPKRFQSNTTANYTKYTSEVNEGNGRKSITTATTTKSSSAAAAAKRSDGDTSFDPKPGTKGCKQKQSSGTQRTSKREVKQNVLNRQLPHTPGGQPINMDGQDIIDTKNHVEDTMIVFLPEMCQRLGLAVAPKDPMELCLKFNLVVPQLELRTDETLDTSMED